MASKDGDQQNSNSVTMTGLASPYSGTGGGGGGVSNGGGGSAGSKLVSPLASRLRPHHPAIHPAIHPGTQFVRPHPDFYRNLYGASHLGSGDISLLETYSRTLGGLGGVIPPSTAPSILTSSSSSISAAGTVKPFSINGDGSVAGGTAGSAVLLTTTSSGLSPSSSSTASSGGSDQSPHPAANSLPATQELKSPGRV